MSRRPLTRIPLGLAVALAALSLLAAPAGAGARRTVAARPAGPARAHAAARAHRAIQCPGANLAPAPGDLVAIRAALLCLHDQVRARHGLPPLRANARLARAAAGHSADMVHRRFFDHTAPDGATFVDRILRAGYARATQGWALGENLAWGTGSLATPAAVMDEWMHSPGHRANILRRSYRDVGFGIALGVPSGPPAGAASGAAGGATYTTDFGVRR